MQSYRNSNRRHNKRHHHRGPRPSRPRHTDTHIEHSQFIRKAIAVEQETYVPKHTFAQLPISQTFKNNIARRNYTTMTPIQDEVMPYMFQGRDVIGIANTGTGKTAAFLIPLIYKVMNNPQERVLIMAPTRELAVQIEDDFMLFAQGLGLISAKCIGGADIKRQMDRLRRDPQFVIGTPGRLKDLEQRGRLHFNRFTAVVLDEVDRMLDMGFIRDMRHILSGLPERHQSAFFSATMPDNAKSLTNEFLHDPITVSVKRHDTATTVNQDIVKIAGRVKPDVLYEVLTQIEGKVLVFGRTKWGMEKLSKVLHAKGLEVGVLHGNKSQGQRQRTLQSFKEGDLRVLLATDIASRGLDIQGVTHVVNYDVPGSYEDYVHRIGRTGRANATGHALTFVD